MFKGSLVALVTPFKQDKIDVPALCELVEFHISEGTHGLVAAGTTGESGTLSHSEKIEVIKTVIKAAKGRVPVIAGTACNATADCIALTREAMELGAHAALIMTPAYIKPTQEGLYLHYSHIAQAVGLPIILYNVPSRTASDILPETVARLAAISNIVGIKEATGQLERFHAIRELTEGKLTIFSGDDITGAEWVLAGAHGIISVTANVAPKLMARLVDMGLDHNEKETRALQAALLPLHQALFCESNPIPVKWVLSRMGRIQPELRLPLTQLTPRNQEKLEIILEKLALMH
ncbi:MAG: 4-hydroxy-tetrahydrodipicolinate synthase [Gammaproteobacteria bacterium]|nr:4-hydroxy-tetrahydrodipicolinate synthase [Gammaproteobacteria bacterium]